MKKITYLEIREFDPYDNDKLTDVILDINNKLDELVDAVNMLDVQQKEYIMSLCYVHQKNPFIDSNTDGHRDLRCPICREYQNPELLEQQKDKENME